MFARVQTVHQPAEKLDALAKLAAEQVATASALPGFRDFFYLVDHDNGKALVVSFWETEADLRHLEANNASVREKVKVESRLDSPLSEIFEVAFRS
ncbi:antibiotic biosynthesis monooxygenase family protein [Diaminobutyricibacter sp. McL0608]|uniref:antibiotic biosynthesis monooxygenase family protein n=1 Tax=Leifsonia sp. McL0608 TaxID=3143537 RepID=UPI0031F30255